MDDDYFEVRPLPWRDRNVSALFVALDRKKKKKQTKKSKQMTVERKEGLPSDRPIPSMDFVPQWAVKQ